MCKLLILDDDPIQHLIFKRMLRKYENYTDTLFSFNGNDVLDFLENHKMNMNELPELIFLDINMPNLNGWLFLEKLKKIYPKLNKLIDVYIISSSIDPQEQESSHCVWVDREALQPHSDQGRPSHP
ncbi:MAG: response regulator [Flavobacterium sp.]|nr:MAG: response regulator [Flavobacterium sp.]